MCCKKVLGREMIRALVSAIDEIHPETPLLHAVSHTPFCWSLSLHPGLHLSCYMGLYPPTSNLQSIAPSLLIPYTPSYLSLFIKTFLLQAFRVLDFHPPSTYHHTIAKKYHHRLASSSTSCRLTRLKTISIPHFLHRIHLSWVTPSLNPQRNVYYIFDT